MNLKKRNEIADTYNKSFEEIDSIKPLKIKEDRTCVWAQYTLIVEDRDSFIKIMKTAIFPLQFIIQMFCMNLLPINLSSPKKNLLMLNIFLNMLYLYL